MVKFNPKPIEYMQNYIKKTVTNLFSHMTRLTFIILIINFSTLGILYAEKANSQNFDKIYVNLKAGNSSLQNILHHIENQTNLSFTFSKEVGDIQYAIKSNDNYKLSNLFQGIEQKEQLKFTAKENLVAVHKVIPKTVIQQNGRLSGKVIDSRGNPMPKATVRILSTTNNIESAIDGSYSFSLAPGKYTIQVSYISYQTKQISDVVIRPGELTRLDIPMEESRSEIETVTVKTTFKKASVAGLYAAQKNAASVTDGISAEQIARTPDNDMGQVLKRVTGLTTVDNRSVVVRGMSDRYNQAQLDGVSLPSTSQSRRDFAFDIIPSEMVSSVVVNKTATPDVSSEFSGGQVSINTLDIPEKNFMSIQIGSGANSQAFGKDFYRLGERKNAEYFGFIDKSAQQPEGILVWQRQGEASYDGIPMGQNTEEQSMNLPLSYQNPDLKYSDLDAIEQSKKFNSSALKYMKYNSLPNQNMKFTLGRVYELDNSLKFGFAGSLNFRNEQNISTFNNVRGTDFSEHNWIDSADHIQNGAGKSYKFNSSSGAALNVGLQGTEFRISLKNMYARTYADNFNESYRLTYRDLSAAPNRQLYQLPEALSLQQHQLTADYLLPWGIKADGMFAYNRINQEILDKRKLQYGLTTTINDTKFFNTPNLGQFSSLANEVNKIDSRMWTHTNENAFNWAISFSKSFSTSNFLTNQLKIGYQGTTKNRRLDVLRVRPMTRNFIGTSVQRVDQPIGLYEEILSEGNFGNEEGKGYYYPEATGGRVSNGKMSSHAAYVLMDQKLWNFIRLVYGVRMEYFDLNNRQEQQIVKQWGPETLNDPYYDYMKTVGDKETRFLPSINATFNLTDKINIRASYSKTAIRPDFRETGLFAFYSYELDGYISGEQVVSTIVDNTDLRFEWYPSAGEIISLTGYYKYLDKPIELTEFQRDLGYYKYANMESATNLGLEMEVRKNLSFIADKEWLTDFFVYANGTLLKSNVKVLTPYDTRVQPNGELERYQERREDQDRPLLGQSPWLINLGLSYWGDYYGATASFNYRGFRTNLTSSYIQGVEFELAPKQLDFQVYGRFLKKKLEAKLNLSNLLNDWTRYYRNNNLYDKDQIGDSDLISKGDTNFNKDDGDQILYRRQDGRRYSLSLTYSF